MISTKDSYFVKQFLPFVLALCTTIAFSCSNKLISSEELVQLAGSEQSTGLFIANFSAVLNGHQLLWLIFGCFLIYFYRKTFLKDIVIEKSIIIPSFMFSLFMLLGDSFKVLNSWELIFGNFFQICFALIKFIGYSSLFYVIIFYIFSYLDNLRFNDNQKSGRISRFVFEEHPFVMSFAIIFICWLPYLILFYPGSVTIDSLCQLEQFFGNDTMSNHWPVFSTCVIGACLKLGKAIGSDNLGIFIYTMIQVLVLSISFSSIFRLMRKWDTPVFLRKILLVFYAVLPIFPGFGQSVIKDTLYVGFFSLYCFFMVLYLCNQSNQNLILNKICLFIFAILICLFRNDGVYIVTISLFAILFLNISKKEKKQLGIGLLTLLFLSYVWLNVIIPNLGIEKGSIREMLSVPFQQTARYVKYHGDEIPIEEREIINKVLEYDALAALYDPEISDAVKWTMTYKNIPPGKRELIEYFTVWLKQFIKHPGTYIQATINNTYGYYYPDVDIYGDGLGIQTFAYNDQNFDFKAIEEWQPWRQAIYNYMLCIQRMPVVGNFVGLGIYTWIIILMIAYLLRKKIYKYIAVYVPVIVVFLICIASPVNRALRYYMPIIAVMPLLIAYFLYVIKQSVEEMSAMSFKTNRKKLRGRYRK